MGGRDPLHRLWARPCSLLLLLAAPAVAEEVVLPDPGERFVHRQWTVDDGLPVDNLTDVVQTPDGWLWIASFDGLLRFDGARFERFDTQAVPELASNRIVDLEVGTGGSLWILPEKRLPARRADGRFHAVAPPEGVRIDVGAMAVDGSGTLWLETDGRLFEVEDDRLIPGPAELEDHAIRFIGAGASGRIWIEASGPRRFAVLDGGDLRWVGIGLRPEEYVRFLTEDGDGVLWIGTQHRLWRWRSRVLEEVVSPGSPAGSAAGRAPSMTRAAGGHPLRWYDGVALRFLQEGPGGAIWEAADRGELWRDGRRVLELPEAGRGVRALAFDHQGTAWLATDTQGLHALKPTRVTALGEAEGLAGGNVYALHQDRRGTIWVGDWDGGLSRVRPAAGNAAALQVDAVPLAAPAERAEALAIYDDPESGMLLIGTPTRLFRVDGDRRLPLAEVSVSIPGERLEGGAIRAIHRARDGRLLLGHRFGLLASRPGDPGDDGWQFRQVPGTAGMRVRAILEDPDGDLWLATAGTGVARLRDGRLSSVTTAGGLSSDLVRALHLDPDGYLWIATEDRGLNRLTRATVGNQPGPEIAVIQKRDGLWDDGLHKILEDDAGWLWLSTNRGIFRVQRAQLEDFIAGRVSRIDSIVYDEDDGMRHREANGGVQDAGLRAKGGRLWFPTQDGVAIFDPPSLLRDLPPPPVHVERLTAGDREIGPAGSAPTAVVLAAEQRSFEIAYTALDFRAPERVRFRYRLAGYDQRWVEAGGRREAFYTRVPPGSYAFEVQARSAEGVWNRDGAALALVVQPFFWETAWFRVAAALLLLAAVAGGFYQRERGQQARRRQLERQVAERTRELESERDVVARQAEKLTELDRAKSELFANVSHEFRTPLTLSLGPLKDLIEGRLGPLEPAVVRELERVRANSWRLLELVEQLLDVARLDAGGLQLRPVSQDLGHFVVRIGERFVALAERRRIETSTTVPEQPVLASFDPEQLDKVLTNLLSNAFKFTPRGGRVTLTLSAPEDGRVSVAVRDTGRGIPEGELARIFDRFYRAEGAARRQVPGTGLGLALAHDLVELHGGTLEVESNPGSGSTFTVHLPLGEAAGGEVSNDASPDEVALPELPLHSHWLEVDRTGFGGSEREPSGDDSSCELDVTTVLVVDDHPDLRAYVRRHLEASYRVIEAADGAAGLEKARRALPDLVISDVMMPEMDGFELTRALKQDPELDFVPVVLLTARAEAEDKLAGLGIGADDYLTKPFDVRELAARVDNLIAQRRRLRERFLEEARAAATSTAAAVPPEPDDGASPSAGDDAFLSRVEAAIDEGLADESFYIDTLARSLAMSRTVLYERLAEVTDVSPARLILERRLVRAAELLRGDANVSETAYAVGFKSVSHFSHRFRRHYGTTPSTFRRAA